MAVVLITGCSTGIGFATAVHLAKNGHKVYATMRNPSKAQFPALLKNKISSIEILRMDVNDDVSVTNAVNQILKKEGFVDVLVNNAGTSGLGPVEEVPMDVFRSDMETNYFGTIRCIKALLPSMREKRKGLIINISSVAGKVYGYFHGTYAPTKAAVEALSECLAQEVMPHGVRVALVEPGVTDTPIFSKGYAMPDYTNYPNIKRFLSLFAASLENHVQPDEVAKVIGDIIEGRRTAFRNPATPDAEPILGWRASQKDEEWIASTSVDDETWIQTMEGGMHLNVRPYMKDPSLIHFEAPAPKIEAEEAAV